MFSGRFNTLLLILKQCVVFYQRWSTENNTLYPDWLKNGSKYLKKCYKLHFSMKVAIILVWGDLRDFNKSFQRGLIYRLKSSPRFWNSMLLFINVKATKTTLCSQIWPPKWPQNTLKRAIKRIFPWKLPLYWFRVVLGTSQNVFGKI